MGRVGRVVAPLAGTLLLAACGKSGRNLEAAQGALRADAEAPGAVAESLYDAHGQLKASAQRVEWLEIPVGFTRKAQSYGRHVLFEGHGVPLEKVREFFASRMFTGEVEEQPDRVFYRAVLPLSAATRSVHLDLHLSYRKPEDSLLIDVEPLTYGGVKPLSVEEAKKVLSDEQRKAE